MKLATAGCPRNCSEAMVKDVGAVAVEGGKWEIYIGGAAGSSVRKGDILCVVDSEEDVLKYMGRFIQYYRENAKISGADARLRRANRDREAPLPSSWTTAKESRRGWTRKLPQSKAAYKDPWKEAYMPAARLSSPPNYG